MSFVLTERATNNRQPQVEVSSRLRNHMFTRVTLVTVLAVCTAISTRSQERFSFFVASTPESVERLLTLAGLRDDDVVVDLGSGNGLIPLTAARMNPRLRGRGVDIDPKLVEQSNERARSEGVADRVRFEHHNAFDWPARGDRRDPGCSGAHAPAATSHSRTARPAHAC